MSKARALKAAWRAAEKAQAAAAGALNKPAERRIPITGDQAALYRRIVEQIERLQGELSAATAGILAGHGVTAAQGVRLEGTADRPLLWLLDYTKVVATVPPAPLALPVPATPPAAPPPP